MSSRVLRILTQRPSSFAVGLALLVASVAAGALWQRFGAPATFVSGAALTVVALLSLAAIRYRLPHLGAPPQAEFSGPGAIQAQQDQPQR